MRSGGRGGGNSHVVAGRIPAVAPVPTTTMPPSASDANTVRWIANSSSVRPNVSGAGGESASTMPATIFQQFAGNNHLADFRRARADFQQLDRAEQAVDFRLPDVAAAAVDLHGLVEHRMTGLGRGHQRGRGQL